MFCARRTVSPTIENYVKLKVMPTPRLHSTKRQEFFCSVCKAKPKSEFHLPTSRPAVVRTEHGPSIEWSKDEESTMKDAKLAVLNEWDEHLSTVHPRQSEREQRRGAVASLHEGHLLPIRNNLEVNGSYRDLSTPNIFFNARYLCNPEASWNCLQ
jgi:hypothetical protein